LESIDFTDTLTALYEDAPLEDVLKVPSLV